MKAKKVLNIFKKSFLFMICTVLCISLCGCGSTKGSTGGVFSSIVQKGVTEKCDPNASISAEGKTTEIDGVTIKLPIDWNYAKTNQSNYQGNNWEGDDAYRGIGTFNCNEEGDGSEAFANSYSINMRWEYIGYTSVAGGYPTHAKYTAKAHSVDMTVGGTDESCVSGGKLLMVGEADNAMWNAYRKCKIMIVNPVNGKACICAPGFMADDDHFKNTQYGGNLNWGGAPLSCMGGITTAVSTALSDDSCGFDQLQPHVGDTNVALEMFFVDPESPLGPCEADGVDFAAAGGGNGKDLCKKASAVDCSDAANLAVTVSYDPKNENFKGHEVVRVNTGSDGSSVCPTTNRALKLRELATGDRKTADCGFFVASVVRMTMDKDYPAGGTSIQEEHMASHPDKWKKVQSNVTQSQACANSDIQPGDVFVMSGHTVIYVGNEAIKAQYDYASDSMVIVGASQDDHGPSIQDHNSWDSRLYNVYRYIGTPDPKENASELSSIGSA